MCWNREVSLVSGITASALSIYLLVYGKGNDIPVALVSLAIALMQFAEVFLWEDVERQQTQQGQQTQPRAIGGQLGLLALFLQPLFLSLGIAIARGVSLTIYVGIVGIWGIIALPTLLPLLTKTWPATPGTCGHLQWSFLEPMLQSAFAPFYWMVMLGGWLFMKPYQEGIHYSGMAIATLAITWLFFPGEWGSLWCFLANFLPLGRLL